MEDEQNKSIFMMEAMRGLGYSKVEVQIRHQKWTYLNFTENLFNQHDMGKSATVHTGSSSDGMSGGMYYVGQRSDYDTMSVLKRVSVLSGKDDSTSKTLTMRKLIYDRSFTPLCKSDENIFVVPVPDADFSGYFFLRIIQTDFESKLFVQRDGDLYLQNWLPKLETTIFDMLHTSRLHDKYPIGRKFWTTVRTPHGPAVTSKGSETGRTLQKIRQLVGEDNPDLEKNMQFDMDSADCVLFNGWPEIARPWITRLRPSGWPTNHIVHKIVQLPCYLAPSGHFDSTTKELQWRLSFNHAERILVEEFSEVQIASCALLKLILKDHIRTIDDTVLSSYLMKTVVFWSSETYEKQFTDINFLSFTTHCLKLLGQCIKQKRLPNYFIPERNMLNSKLTQQVAKQLSDVVEFYTDDILEVVRLRSFERIFAISSGDQAVMKTASCQSCVLGWIETRLGILERMFFAANNNLLWMCYLSYKPIDSLQRLSVLVKDIEKFDGNLQYFQRMLENCIGMLHFCIYLRSKKKSLERLHIADHLLTRSSSADASCFPLRTATFYLAEEKFDSVIKLCDKVLGKKMMILKRGQFVEYLYEIINNLIKQIIQITDQTVLDRLLVEIRKDVPFIRDFLLLYSRDKSEPEINLLNSLFIAHERISFDVTFMTSEIEALPIPLQYEVVPQNISYISGKGAGIRIHPVLFALFLKFLCFLKRKKENICTELISNMENVIECLDDRYHTMSYNLMAYCFASTGRHKDAAKCVIKSLQSNPSRNNTSYGYLCVTISFLKDIWKQL